MAGPTLTINGLLLDTAGFAGSLDLTDLEEAGPLRGSDFVAQGVDGATFRPKVQGPHLALCSLRIFGRNTSAGVPHPDAWSGIKANVATIRSTCITASKSALVTATLTYPDATTRSGQVYCPRLDVSLNNGDRTGNGGVLAVLEVVIPAGALA